MRHQRIHPFGIVLALAVGNLASAFSEGRLHFDLPREPLDQALRDFAVQAHWHISYNPELLDGLQGRPIRGDFAPSDVLTWLLSGTQLRAVNINQDTVQVLEHSAKDADAVRTSGLRLTDFPAAPETSDFSAAAEHPSDEHDASVISEIVVTGTNITGVDNKTAPVLVFDREAIERSGYATTEDFLDSLPQNVKSTANSADGILAGGLGPNNIENSTSVNLRGLGTTSTLTLLNGHRVAPSAYGSGVDVSMIPLGAVERIDVLTDGSSAVYGSDAIGGVVNIILRRDFNGEESSARVEALTRGGGFQKQASQSIGRTWSGGGALAVLQFQDSNAIPTTQRDFTQNLPQPADIYPASKRYSGVLSAHQELAPHVEVFSDVLAFHDNGFRNWTTGGFFSSQQHLGNTTNSVSGNVGLRWQPFGDWHVEGAGLFSQVNSLARENFTPAETGYANGAPYLRNYSAVKEANLKLDGTLCRWRDSSIKGALGGAYRREDFSSLAVYDGSAYGIRRHASAVYAEVYAPLVTPTLDVPLVHQFDVSAAIRRDAYSDFGARQSPRIGLYWAPIASLGIRAAFSASFRAPSASEIINDVTANAAFVEPSFPLPGGTTGNVLFYGNQVLGPETTHNVTIGLDFQPQALKGLRLALNYYRIRYANRIINAPYAENLFITPQVYGPLVKQFPDDAAVSAFVAGLNPPQMLYDDTDNGTGLAGVRYAAPYGDLNAARQFTEGADVGVHYAMHLSSAQRLVGDLNATYIRTLETAYCGGCSDTDPVNTYGNPLHLRLRAGGGWSNGAVSVNTAISYANRYTDVNVLPYGRIGAFTTVDVNAGYRLPIRLPTTFSVAVGNLLDARPPRTAPAFNSIEYDPSNADPRGRSVALQVRSQW